MVSNLYNAKEFYELQRKKRIAQNLDTSKKLKRDRKGFYLIKRTKTGELYKQRIKADDYVYSRAEGVTKYSKERDKKRIGKHVNETINEHKKHSHLYDRKTKSRYFKV